MQILHILSRFSGAGPSRSVIDLVKFQKQLGLPYRHRLAWLKGEPYPMAMILAARAGITLVRRATPEVMADEIASSDIVHLHFWNNPDLYRLLCTAWPACRLVIRFTMAGLKPPQIITPSVVHYADYCSASPICFSNPALQEAQAAGRAAPARIPFDHERLADCHPQAHRGFNVGYIGTVNFGKMHPAFVAMSASIQVPDLKIVICGVDGGEVRNQVVQLGAEDLFDFRGFVEDIRPVLSQLDVFGYPLCEDTSATDERSLQEAMAVGIPPVVFPRAGIQSLVQHNQTGLVVESESEYRRAVELLYHQPEERRRLGSNARAFALENFHGAETAARMGDIYQQLLASPKRERSWAGPTPEFSAARHFVATLGSSARQFERNLEAPDAAAEASIAASSTLLAGGEGGLIHYRNTYPEDPYLRFWTSLVLRHQGRVEAAQRELAAARQLGLRPDYA